jgi:tetratricopeptide (TPR) repeat protein
MGIDSMKKILLVFWIIFLCISPVSADKGKGLFSGEILQADLDVFIGNVSDTPSFTVPDDAVKTSLQVIAEWIDIGKTQLRSGNWAGAEEAFSKVTGLDPKNDEGWEGYLLSIRGSGDFHALLRASEMAAEKNPSFVPVWKYKGIALSGLDRSEEALSAFEKALEVDPSYYQAWYYKGIALDSLKRYDESIHAYDQVLKTNQNFSKAWNNKGVTLNYLGRYDEAIAAFEKAIQIDPAYKAAQMNKNTALEEKRKKSLSGVDIIDDSSMIIPSAGNMSEPVSTMIPQISPKIPAITSVTPTSASDCDNIALIITGTDFQTGAMVSLTRTGGTPIHATDVTVHSPTSITCMLPIAGKGESQKPRGGGEAWNVIVTNPGGQAVSLTHGFTIQPGTMLFDNGNIYAVFNNPDVSPQFTIDTDHIIRYIETYHWNNAKGSPPGTISVQHTDGTIYGPWNARSQPGQNNAPNVYWIVNTNTPIKAGTYTIIDSDPETWSQNVESYHTGFARVQCCPA